jgi:D-3-phosphoglycerate dehydrogenase / 2-oxoglutarate reductase
VTILLLEPIHQDAQALLAHHDQTILATTDQAVDQVLNGAPVQAIVTRGRGRVTDTLIARCPELQVVARCGVGLDNIDLIAASTRSIPVIYAPGSTTQAVAEHTLMLMLAASRQLRQLTNAVHSGQWDIRNSYSALELRGRTLGILGFGAIGSRVAELAEAFGMFVITWSRSARSSRYPAHSLEKVLQQADVVSVHVSLTAETHHLLGKQELAHMKSGSILINTARGGVIDQSALADALELGILGYFAADVLDPEPPNANERLLKSERTMITPHTAAITDATYRAMCLSTVRNVLAVLRGEAPEAQSVYRIDDHKGL